MFPRGRRRTGALGARSRHRAVALWPRGRGGARALWPRGRRRTAALGARGLRRAGAMCTRRRCSAVTPNGRRRSRTGILIPMVAAWGPCAWGMGDVPKKWLGCRLVEQSPRNKEKRRQGEQRT